MPFVRPTHFEVHSLLTLFRELLEAYPLYLLPWVHVQSDKQKADNPSSGEV